MRSLLFVPVALWLVAGQVHAATPSTRVENFRKLFGSDAADKALIQKVRFELALAKAMPVDVSLEYLSQVVKDLPAQHPEAAPGLRAALQMAGKVAPVVEHKFRSRAILFSFLGPFETEGYGLIGEPYRVFGNLARACVYASALPGMDHAEKTRVFRQGLKTLDSIDEVSPSNLAGTMLRALERAMSTKGMSPAAQRSYAILSLAPWIAQGLDTGKTRYLRSGAIYDRDDVEPKTAFVFAGHLASTLVVHGAFSQDERGRMAMAIRRIRGQTEKKALGILGATFRYLADLSSP